MRYLYVCIIIALSACTSSHYSPVPGSNATIESLDSDLWACKKQVGKKMTDDRDHSGVIIGGVILGPIGAIVGDSIANQSTKPKPDYNAEIQNCMRTKGYEGTSSGYN